MTLTLVTGPANSAKAGEVLGAYAAAVARGALLVVPTASDVDHFTRELVQTGVVLGTVTTFDGLVDVIARRAGYGGRRLTALQRERVLAGVVARSELDTLRASAAGAGFEAAAGDLIAELQRALVTPQRFVAALRAWAAEDVRRAPYTHELGRIYGDYVRELDRLGRVDRELWQWRALDALRAEGRASARWGRDAVFVYGFDDLTTLERDAVQTLASIPGVPVTVSLTYEPGRAALVARAGTAEALRPLADEVRELPALDAYYAPASRAVLHRLERELFEPATAPPPAVGSSSGISPVVLLEAGGERAEAELVAAEILALARDGMPLEEIVVVYRSPARVAELVERVFAGYGIGVAGPRTLPLSFTALGRGVIAAARCALIPEQASPADLLAYLRVPGLLRDPDLADELEAAVRRGGLRTVSEARARLGWDLRELDSLARAPDPGPELCRLARRLQSAPHRGAAGQLTAGEELDARALAALVRGVGELAELEAAGGRPLRLDPAAWIELLARLPVPAGRELGPTGAAAPGAVRLAEPAEIRARRFAAVFVCGLQEGEFPGPAAAEPFLSDERRFELALASGLALPPREDALDGERYLFYASVSRASERVYLAYRSSDEEGNLALPSPFVADVAELLGPEWRRDRRRRLLADVTWPAAEAPTDRECARARAAARAPRDGDAPEPDRRLSPAALAVVRHTRVVSAGALETFGDCPVRWLVEGELHPEPLAPEPEPLARGTLIHEILERVLSDLDGPITAATLTRAEALLEAIIAELAAAVGAEDGAGGATAISGGSAVALAAGQPAVVRAGALRAIEADLRRYLRHEARSGLEWRPYGLELRFGFQDDRDPREGDDAAPVSLPALVLGEGEGTVRVRGLIDRIDVGPGGEAIVRDYKSGAPRSDWPVARWSQDRRLQVALYMLVARELAGLDVVAGVYQPLRGEDLRARGVIRDGVALGDGVLARDARSADELDAELVDAAERAVALAARLRSGRLAPCPQTCSRDGCAYPEICRSR